MKKIILAINNKKIVEKIKQKNNIKILFKNLQYREAILEILEKNKNIDFIIIDEKIPGEISIEELIKKIKLKNDKINIIFFLEKENIEKENKLKNLGIKKIYINKKINNKKTTINLSKKNKKEILKDKKLKINKNIIITISGRKKVGKSTIINLILIQLINKNKKILLINLNKKIEKNYLLILGKKHLKNKTKNNIEKNNNLNKKEKIINKIKEIEIKINKNIIFIYNFEKIMEINKKEILEYFFQEYIKKYDYIIIDSGEIRNKKIKQIFIEKSNKNIIILGNDLIDIKEINNYKNNINNCIKKEKNNLYIIQNKYKYNSISHFIIKNIFRDYANFSNISYNKKFHNLAQQIQKNEKLKLDRITNFRIAKLLK